MLLSRPSSSSLTASSRHRDVLFTHGVASDHYHTVQHHRGKFPCEQTGGKMVDQLMPGCCIKGYDLKINQFHLQPHCKAVGQEYDVSKRNGCIYARDPVPKKVMGRDSGCDWGHLVALFIDGKMRLKPNRWKSLWTHDANERKWTSKQRQAEVSNWWFSNERWHQVTAYRHPHSCQQLVSGLQPAVCASFNGHMNSAFYLLLQ